MAKLRAGAATSNISPSLGVSINGGMQDRAAEHIHDELHARCLVLDDGHERVALVVVDSCMIPALIHDAAKELIQGATMLPLDRVLVSATHAHSCPTVAGVFQSEPDAQYSEFLAIRLADGVRRAIHNLAPAKAAWGVGRVPQHVFNRRWKMREGFNLTNPFGLVDHVKMNPPSGSPELVEPAGTTDPAVTVLAVRHESGAPLGLLANYSLHYVGGTGPGEISADYFGEFARQITRRLQADAQDPPFVAMMSNGTSGDVNNVNFQQARPRQPPYEQIRRVASEVADEVQRVWQSLEFRDDVPLAMHEERVDVRRRLPTLDEVAKARFILGQGNGFPLKTINEIYARETVLLADAPIRFATLVQAVRIGELGIVTSPCETFVETGLAIKTASPLKPTMVISLANDYAGYLPSPEQHRLGGYETWRARSSCLNVDAEPTIRAAMLSALRQVAH